MAITTQRQESTLSTTVAVRVPHNADGDLASEAERRLTGIDEVREATVDGYRSIEPGLSATTVTVTAVLETRTSAADVHDALSETVGIEGIEELESA